MNITFTPLSKKEPLIFEYFFYETSFGKLLIGSWQKHIVFISFVESKAKALQEVKVRFPAAKYHKKENLIHKQVLQYLKNPRVPTKTISVATIGTPFQQSVWSQLQNIPFAQTVMYSQVAKKIGKPSAVRAVASAVARNPIAILIPCHRVLPSSGGVGKYHWGPKNKINILAWEGINTK